MRRRAAWMAWSVAMALGIAPVAGRTQEYAPAIQDTSSTEAAVPQFDLSGPRVGMIFLPSGAPRSLFGWHVEHQASASRRGPWFVVETVFMFAGIEDHVIAPSGSLVFGVRMPSGYEFGVGPSASLGPRGGSTGVVIAAGRSYRFGGVRVPVNLAVSLNRGGQTVSVSTGWALRDAPLAQK